MKTIASVIVIAAAFTAFALKAPGWAQAPRPSQHASVSQQVAGTTITIEYNRPVARGRQLFGALVPYDRVWCPGADDCTTIELSTDIKIEGQALAAGTHPPGPQPGVLARAMVRNGVEPILPLGDGGALRARGIATPES